MKDTLVRAITPNQHVRILACTTTELVETARRQHDLWPTSAAALGRVLSVTAILGSMLKSEKEKVTVQINGGGAMYAAYGSTSVPSGWLIPFPYIRIGRQNSPDEGIAKVRLIVPHSEGQTSASSNVYPCFYEITFQKMRD